MKKKAALLLALVMIFTMLPMNVFGAVTVLENGRVLNPAPQPHRTTRTIEVTVDMAQLSTTGSPAGDFSRARMEFTLSGAHTNDNPVGFWHTGVTDATLAFHNQPNPWAGNVGIAISPRSQVVRTVAGVATPVNAATLFDITPLRTGRNTFTAWVSYYGGGAQAVPITGFSGTLVLEIQHVVAGAEGARLTAVRTGRWGAEGDVVTLVNNQLVVFGAPGQGVIIDINGDPRNFVYDLLLPPITITERAPQAIPPGQSVLRLIGPRDFVWNTGIPGHLDEDLLSLTYNAAFNSPSVVLGTGMTLRGGEIVGTGDAVRRVGFTNDNRPIIYLNVFVGGGEGTPAISTPRTFPATELHGVIEIEGLLLSPQRHRVSDGDIRIDAYFGYWGGGQAATGDLRRWVPQFEPDAVRDGFPGFEPPTEARPGGDLYDDRYDAFNALVAEQLVLATAIETLENYEAEWNAAATTLAALTTSWGALHTEVLTFHSTYYLPAWIDFLGQEGQVEIARAEVAVATIAYNAARNALMAAQQSFRNDMDAVLMELTRLGEVPASGPPSWMDSLAAVNAIMTGLGRPWLTIADLNELLVGWTPGTLITGGGGGTADEFRERVLNTNWRERNLLVGIRRGVGLELRTHGDELPVLRSGVLSRPATNIAWDAASPHRTARLQIVELVPGALNTAFHAARVNFEFEDGVQLLGAQWRLVNGGIGWTNVIHDENHPDATQEGIPIITDNDLSLFLPRQTEVTRNRTLEIYFFLSVEAGFEARNNGAPIEVTVDGLAVTALGAGERSIDIAEVIDPISVRLDGPISYVDVGQVMTPAQAVAIAPIVIEEAYIGALPIGSMFTLALDALPFSPIGIQGILGGTVVIDPVSGMQLRRTEVGGGAAGTSTMVRFEVIRESIDAPATITIRDLRVFGTFVHGVQYVMSINGGTAFPPQNLGDTRNVVANNTARGAVSRGLFDNIPYYVEVVRLREFDETIVAPPGTPPEERPDAPVVRPTFTAFNVSATMAPHTPAGGGAVIAEPMMMIDGITSMAVRAFGDSIGIHHENMGANAAGNIFITGTHFRTGDTITVTLFPGTGNATIANITTGAVILNGDIATWVEAMSQVWTGAAGSIRTTLTEDFRTFVPVRFLVYAFGAQIQYMGNGVSSISAPSF
jgi:hypothetical protein